MRPPCAIPDCGRRRYRGYKHCATHYHRRLKGERMDAPIRSYTRQQGRTCSCGKPAEKAGFCDTCYRRNRRQQARGAA